MTDANQLPPLPEPEGVIVVGTQALRAFTAYQMRAYALQALAQVQGEPFGYIHHFVAHDEHGALIDTTWEADGCADALPHPTHPAAWKWSHATPFYTTPQPAQAAQAEAKTDEMGTLFVKGALSGIVDAQVRDLWPTKSATHPAPGVPEDVAQDAQRYRWLRRKACVIGKTTYCGEETGQPILDFVNLPDVTEVIRRDSASTLDAAIDAAMLTAASNAKGES